MLEHKRHILNPPLWPAVQVTKLPTTFFMFLRVPLTHLDRWLAFFTKFPRDYRCSQTKNSIAIIMALDHSRLGLENRFLENKSGRIFCVGQVYFTKSCQQVWGRVNQPFILFIHHIWGETVPWGAEYHTDLEQNAVFHNCITICTHSIFRTIEARVGFSWAFSETAKKFPKSPIRLAGGFSHLTSAKVDCLNYD